MLANNILVQNPVYWYSAVPCVFNTLSFPFRKDTSFYANEAHYNMRNLHRVLSRHKFDELYYIL